MAKGSRREANAPRQGAPVRAACIAGLGRRAALALLAASLGRGAALAAPAPLTQADVDLYLSVMQVAAQRVQHPTAEDERVFADADSLTLAANSGQAVAMSEQQVDDMTLALELRTQMDEIVAADRRLDVDHYDAVRDRIEEEAGELHCNSNAPDVPDRDLLAPQLAQITQLMRTVRGLDALACGLG